MKFNSVHKAACHCGAVGFELKLSQGLQAPSRCNCSICSKRGAIAISVALADLKVTKGLAKLTLYQFNTMPPNIIFAVYVVFIRIINAVLIRICTA